jgi:septin family protein
VLANIVAIVGTAGIGKTFFAQQLYNDNMLKEHFNLQAWVCLSEELDSFKLTKTIVEAITSSMCDAEDKNLQITLEKKLVGRKFLLVLDDVCNKNCAGWEVLRNSFKVGAPGSR